MLTCIDVKFIFDSVRSGLSIFGMNNNKVYGV